MPFAEKNILVAVTGGIAAYKSAFLVRELKKRSANVRVMMTKAAEKFVTPLTFETLSENNVLKSLFPKEGGESTAHIDWARWPDLLVVCPATANTIGKIASGISDNAVTTTIMASTVPVLFCPAMNKEMYANPIYQHNEKMLKNFHYHFISPAQGELACGEEGWGRLADPVDIVDKIGSILSEEKDFADINFLITAGPTEEPLDPVRFISNHSSGKMGFALAHAAKLRGGNVTLVSGPTNIQAASDVFVERVQTAQEMKIAVDNNFDKCDIVIMSAAVCDFRPVAKNQHKIKKNIKQETLLLEKTHDILFALGQQKGNKILVGFSLETENEIENSKAKLQKKNLDFIVVNNPLEEGAGFKGDTNKVAIVDKGSVEELPLMSKDKVAHKILDKILQLLKDNKIKHV